MSRTGAALAYDLTAAAPRPAPRTSQVRLLGGVQPRPTRTYRERVNAAVEAHNRPPMSPQMRLVYAPEPDWSAYVPEAPARARVVRVQHPVWLAASVVCTLALVVVVLQGLAAKPSGGRKMYLAGYTAEARAQRAQDPPVIDVTTDPGQGEQAPPAAAVQPPGSYDVVGGPSISVQQIERVLAQYGSGAAGKGQALYDLGVRYGIDPAYALAFFVHESGCGTKGVARFTHSLGNIRWTPGYDSYEGYRSYPSWEAGFEDWYKLITDLYVNGWGLRTVDKIVPVYAPSGDSNNPPAYIQSVKSMVESWRGK